jgi:citronellol/citronellal dehydrogenase
VANLKGKTVVITGGSRGIGRAIALKCAKDGANIVLASKTVEPHPKLPGTIHTVAKEVEEAGGNPLPLQVDIRFDEQVEAMVATTVETFGGIDVMINNAGAINLTDVASTPMKRYDLMQQVNVRGAYLCAAACLPHLRKSEQGHILNLSPPVSLDPKWLKGHVAYTLSKYGMSISALGMAEEFKEMGIAVNALWPRTIISTAAVNWLMGEDGMKNSRTPEIMADAVYEIITTEDLAVTGQLLLDEDFLRTRGVQDFSAYLSHPEGQPLPDLYVEAV